jgi:hypothetical protein
VIVSIHQPHYLPWLRYFDKIARSDLFIVLDDADFNKNGWQNRNRLKGPAGPQVLTIPVRHRLGERLDQITLSADQPWARKHLRTVEQLYAHSPYLTEHRTRLERFYSEPWERLVDLALDTIRWHLGVLGIATPMVRSSELAVPGRATERLVGMLRAVGGTAYLTGAHGLAAYLDPALFRKAGIQLLVHHWACPEYQQLWPKAGFAPDLVTLDLVLNEGPRAGEILARGGGIAEGPEEPTPALAESRL